MAATTGLTRLARLAESLDRPLLPHQRRIARLFFGPQRETVAVAPKGSLKTSLGALIAVDHLLAVERPLILVGAGSRDQARVCFEEAKTLAEHPAMGHKIRVHHLELRGPGGGLLRVVASDGGLAHGPTPSLMIVDELWCHKSPAFYDACRSALVKRPGSKLLVLSTAAATLDSPLGHLRERLLSGTVKRSGVVTEAHAPGLALIEWSLDPETDDLDDDRLVAKVNPPPWITADVLAEQRLALPRSVFLQFHAGVWAAGEGAWLPAGAWSACRAEYEVEDGEAVWIGVDVGGSRASSAIVAVTEDLRVAYVGVWQGDDSVLQLPDAILHLAERFTVREIAFDPWRFHSEALRLERDFGLTMVDFPQSHARMTVTSEGLHHAIVQRQLRHFGHPDLDRHVAQAVARHTGRGWRLDKADRNAQIDSCVSLAMATERAQEQPAEPVRLLGWI
jgi:phage terminase large subunit-like protein